MLSIPALVPLSSCELATPTRTIRRGSFPKLDLTIPAHSLGKPDPLLYALLWKNRGGMTSFVPSPALAGDVLDLTGQTLAVTFHVTSAASPYNSKGTCLNGGYLPLLTLLRWHTETEPLRPTKPQTNESRQKLSSSTESKGAPLVSRPHSREVRNGSRRHHGGVWRD